MPKLRVSAFVSVGGLAEAKHFPFGLRHLHLRPRGSAQPPGTIRALYHIFLGTPADVSALKVGVRIRYWLANPAVTFLVNRGYDAGTPVMSVHGPGLARWACEGSNDLVPLPDLPVQEASPKGCSLVEMREPQTWSWLCTGLHQAVA